MAAPVAVKTDQAVAAPPKPPPTPGKQNSKFSLSSNSNSFDLVAAGSSGNPAPAENRSKKWQMEMMMEKLRSKRGQYKSYAESAKLLKIALLDKRNPMEMQERQQLQKCLDTLQHSFKVTSLQGMVERLGTVTRQFGYSICFKNKNQSSYNHFVSAG